MTALRITFKNEQLGSRVKRVMTRNGERVREAMRLTAQQAADEIKRLGDLDIRGAGKFSTRWTDAYTVKVGEGGGSIRIRVNMGIPYWRVFQFGAVIQGKPLLWIPLSFASDAQGVMARDYPAPLFRVNRKVGAPLLLTPGKPAQVKYFGIDQVRIPKKFHLREISANVAKTLQAKYRANFKKVINGR